MTERRKQASGFKSLGILLGWTEQDMPAPLYFSGGRITAHPCPA